MEQPRGRSPSQGNRNHISPVPSPHLQYHDASQNFGLDPAISNQTFSTGAFNAAGQFTTPYLESTQPHQTQGNTAEAHFYTDNHFDQAAYQGNQYPGQTLDSSYTQQNEYMYQNTAMENDFGNNQEQYEYEQPYDLNQRSNINPSELSKMSSPQEHTSPSLLSPEHVSSPGLPASPTSTNGQFYTPQHSRHQSLDPSSAYQSQGEFQGQQFQQIRHHRALSDQSDISSNAGNSPYLGQQDVFESVENRHSPYQQPQMDSGSTYGMDTFSLGDHVSPAHSPYISPRLMPTQGLGIGQDALLGQNHMSVPGPEIYATQAEQYNMVAAMHARNGSTISDMGQADQFAPPTIQIDPAPGVSRQNSFEPGGGNFVDQLSPPSSKGRGRSQSDLTGKRSPLSRSASPAARSPSVQASDNLSVRSHSPGLSRSRDSSPGLGSSSKNRRASTSSVNSRDYILDLADPSRPNSSATHSSTRVQKHPANFQCNLCPKKFTRAYNLRSHLRTHTDERPFVCTICKKAFARQHDRKRHEGLHSGEKKFVCKGELHSSPGQMWGCGRRFARADALGRHFRSEAGRVCIKPLLDEEALERRNKTMMEQAQFQQSSNMGVGGLQPAMIYSDAGTAAAGGQFTLPAALLAQYPALQNIDWSQVPSAADEGLSGYEDEMEGEGDDGYLSDLPGQVVGHAHSLGLGGYGGGEQGVY